MTDETGQPELLSLTPPQNNRGLQTQPTPTNPNLFLGLPLVTTETDSLSADTPMTDETGQPELLSLTPPQNNRGLQTQPTPTNPNLFLGLPLVTTETDSLSADTPMTDETGQPELLSLTPPPNSRGRRGRHEVGNSVSNIGSSPEMKGYLSLADNPLKKMSARKTQNCYRCTLPVPLSPI